MQPLQWEHRPDGLRAPALICAFKGWNDAADAASSAISYVGTALNAESGLQQADILNPDAIIVDLRMPLINGLGFLYRLREREGYRHTPVAIVTADYTLDDSIPRELAELGAELHFKPLWLEDVVDLAHSLLGSEDADRTPPAHDGRSLIKSISSQVSVRTA